MPRKVDLSSMSSLTPVSKEEKQALEDEVQKQMQAAIDAADQDALGTTSSLFSSEGRHRVKSKPGEPDWLLVEEDAQKELGKKLLNQKLI